MCHFFFCCTCIVNLHAEFRALWARKGLQSFSAAACTSPKIHFAERSVELSAFGGQPRREAQRRSPSAAYGSHEVQNALRGRGGAAK